MRREVVKVRKSIVLSPLAKAVFAFCAAVSGIPSATAQTAAPAPEPEFLTIPSGQKFIMQLETALHSRTTRKGDQVEFTTAADVVGDTDVLIPNKSLVTATVTKARARRPYIRASRNPAAIQRRQTGGRNRNSNQGDHHPNGI